MHSFPNTTFPCMQSMRLNSWEQDKAKERITAVDQTRCYEWLHGCHRVLLWGNICISNWIAQLPTILPRYPDLTQAGDMKLASYCLKCKWCMMLSTSLFLNVHRVVSRQLSSISILLLFRKGRQNIPEEEKSIFSWHLNTNSKEIPVL